MKEPFTVRVKEGAPAVAAVGDIEAMVGTGFAAGLMRKVKVLERSLLPAPEKRLRVLMVIVPGLAMRLASTVAVTVEASTTVVGTVLPFHWTILKASSRNLCWMLVTVRVKAAPPAFALLGARKAMGALVGPESVAVVVAAGGDDMVSRPRWQ